MRQDAAQDGPGTEELFPESLAVLAEDSNWSLIAHALWDEVRALLVDQPNAEDDYLAQSAYERVFDRLILPRTAAFVVQLWAPANAAAGYTPKSVNIPSDEAVSEPSETLETLLEDVSDVMDTIAVHQLGRAHTGA